MRRWQLIVFLTWAGFVGWGFATGRLGTEASTPATDAGTVAPPVTVAPVPPRAPVSAATPDDAGEVVPPELRPIAVAPAVDGGAPAFDEVRALLGVADDGTALEIFPIPVVNRRPDAGEDEDTTVIWQDDSGLISIRRSKRTRLELARLPPSTPPDDAAQTLLTKAQAALDEGRFEDARFAASHARQWAPESPKPWLLLGEIARRQSDIKEAQWCYREAKRKGGRVPSGVEARLTREEDSVGTLTRSETAHATIAAPFEVHEPTRIALHEAIEKAWVHVREQLGFEPQGKVMVVLYRDDEFTAREGAVAWAAGDYDGRVRLTASAAGNARGASTLTHELTHHFVAAKKLGRVPAWFNEGVAQQVTQLAAYDAPIHCGGGHGFPLGELGDGFCRFDDRREAHVAYLTAFHAVQRLGERTPLPTAFPRLQGASFEQAFEAAYGESVLAFARRFDTEQPMPR